MRQSVPGGRDGLSTDSESWRRLTFAGRRRLFVPTVKMGLKLGLEVLPEEGMTGGPIGSNSIHR